MEHLTTHREIMLRRDCTKILNGCHMVHPFETLQCGLKEFLCMRSHFVQAIVTNENVEITVDKHIRADVWVDRIF
ncbi:unnamed protein product [Thelazia callipaeda]|uniref:DUF223 domain-containing protein n=1 Tax=Thelazia callipaeda TaxID=103827 RepID=A0A0N5CXT2_THECL|nr:unnamed protein product [Thelazia callipaeda]